MCCTVTLSDSSAAPGDSPAEEEIDAACRAQPRRAQDPAAASPEQRDGDLLPSLLPQVLQDVVR